MLSVSAYLVRHSIKPAQESLQDLLLSSCLLTSFHSTLYCIGRCQVSLTLTPLRAVFYMVACYARESLNNDERNIFTRHICSRRGGDGRGSALAALVAGLRRI